MAGPREKEILATWSRGIWAPHGVAMSSRHNPSVSLRKSSRTLLDPRCADLPKSAAQFVSRPPAAEAMLGLSLYGHACADSGQNEFPSHAGYLWHWPLG